MPANPWLAIDAATSPRVRARELRQAWERFLGYGHLDAVRAPIADSWRRSEAAGIDPAGTRRAPVLADADEASARWDVHPLAAAAPLIRESLASIAADSEHLIVVSDADGLLLWIGGNARVRMQAADSMNFTEGALWSEHGAGTNAIGTALAADHAVQVFAAEHFNEIVQNWTCAAAPVHDPESGKLLGIIDLTGKMATVHPHSLAVASTAASAVEFHLRCELHEQDVRLRARYRARIAVGADPRALVTSSGRVLADRPEGWLQGQRLDLPAGGGELVLRSGAQVFVEPVGHEEAFIVRALPTSGVVRGRPLLKLIVLGRDRAHAEVDGRPIQLSRRHSEVLALLSMQADGMTTEELAADLYGDSGTPSTTRVEIHRLRKLLGRWMDTDPLPTVDGRAIRRRAGDWSTRPRRRQGGSRALPRTAAAPLPSARRGARARLPGGVAARGRDDRRRQRHAVGVAPVILRARGSRRLEAAAHAVALPRPAAQPRRYGGAPLARRLRRRLMAQSRYP